MKKDLVIALNEIEFSQKILYILSKIELKIFPNSLTKDLSNYEMRVNKPLFINNKLIL
tara:strand:+ start:105 stop:278 length:174 start_codon:yes stop_codon:yes gene_type:complete